MTPVVHSSSPRVVPKPSQTHAFLISLGCSNRCLLPKIWWHLMWANSRLWWTPMKMTLPGSCNVFSCHSQPASLREQWLFKNSSAARPLDLHLLVFQQQLSTYGLAVDCWKFLMKAQKSTFWVVWRSSVSEIFLWVSDYVKTLYRIYIYIIYYKLLYMNSMSTASMRNMPMAIPMRSFHKARTSTKQHASTDNSRKTWII